MENAAATHRPAGSQVLATLRRAIFLVSLPFGILHFALPIFGREIGADALQIGLFFSAFSLMTVLLRPAVGAALDRYGRRPFLVAGLAGYGLTMLAFAWARDVGTVLLARTLQGSASALFWLASDAVTADVSGADRRGGAFGGIGQANMAGAMAGALFGFGVLFSTEFLQGWQWLFAGYGLVSLLAAAWVAWRLPETRHPAPARASAPLPRSRTWALLLLIVAVTGASAAMLSPIMMVYLAGRLETSVRNLAYAYLPAAILTSLFQGRLGRLADRFGRKPLMVLSTAVAAAGSLAVPRLGSLWHLSALWALQAVCFGAGDPAEQALVADLTSPDQRGRAYGVLAMAGGLGMTVGPAAGGWLYDRWGPLAPFGINGVILAACALVLALWLREPARDETR